MPTASSPRARKNLPATMLAWHYRSRSESLISFTNAAFYARQSLTIPDRDAAGAGADRDCRARPRRTRRHTCDALLGAAAQLSFHGAQSLRRPAQRGRGRLHRAAGARAAAARNQAQHRHRRLHRGAAGRDRERARGAGRRGRGLRRDGSRRNTRARRTTSSAACS